VADLRRNWSTILKAAPVPTKTAAAFQQSAVTLDRVAAFCFTRNAHHSLNSLASGQGQPDAVIQAARRRKF